MPTARYSPPGFCAIDPRAYGAEFPTTESAPTPAPTDSGAVVLSVGGPLCYSSKEFVTYDMILAAVRAAVSIEGAHTVALILDSPGGDVPGAFDTARQVRRIIKAAGKRYLVHTSSGAASAAYALACTADEISVSSTGQLGSIGVITAIESRAAAENAVGLRYAIITSGPRKADGNPHLPISADAITAYQTSVDVMASEFFRLVDEHRHGCDSRALGAAQFVGQEAVNAKLADRVESREEFLNRASTIASIVLDPTKLSTPQTAHAAAEIPCMRNKAEIRAALAKAAEEETDEKEKAKAMRALKAFDGDEDKEEDKDEKAKASAVAASAAALATSLQAVQSTLTAQTAELNTLKAALAAKAEAEAAKAKADERTAFFASRPDLSEDVIKSLAAVDLDTAKTIVASIPVGESRVKQMAATPHVTPGDGHATVNLDPTIKANMARFMGLTTVESEVVNTPTRVVFGQHTHKVL